MRDTEQDQTEAVGASRSGRGRRWSAVSGAARVLFVSGSLGRGHDSLAGACASVLAGAGAESRMVDSLELMGERSGRLGSWVFRRLVGGPLYDSFHFGPLHDDGRMGAWADRRGASRLREPLRREIEAYRPDVIVPVFASGVTAACDLRRLGAAPPVVVYLPDAVAHRIWVDEAVDLYLVTSALGAASVRRYQPEADVRVVGAPVAPAFHTLPSRSAARAEIGIPDDAPAVLLMAGAWGIGPLDEVAAALAASGLWVLAVAGTNQHLLDRLHAVARADRRIVPLGLTDRVPALMAASDVVVTTSGATCGEARAAGRGLVLLDVVPGHGRENLLHQLELGGAAVAPATPRGVTRVVTAYLADPRRWGGDPPPGDAGRGFLDALEAVVPALSGDGTDERVGDGSLAVASQAGGNPLAVASLAER